MHDVCYVVACLVCDVVCDAVWRVRCIYVLCVCVCL